MWTTSVQFFWLFYFRMKFKFIVYTISRTNNKKKRSWKEKVQYLYGNIFAFVYFRNFIVLEFALQNYFIRNKTKQNKRKNNLLHLHQFGNDGEVTTTSYICGCKNELPLKTIYSNHRFRTALQACPKKQKILH